MNIKSISVLVSVVLICVAYDAIAQTKPYIVFFDHGSAKVFLTYPKMIKDIADHVKAQPGSMVEVVGHTDTSENEAISLSLQRARNVAAELVARGVPYERIKVEGVGDSQLLVPTEKDVRNPQNR